MDELKTLSQQVEKILEEHEEARNSDKRLTWLIWTNFYGFTGHMNYERYEGLPDQDAIKRIRAKIQNDERRLVPTTWSVAKKRGWNKDRWEAFLGYGQTKLDQVSLGV